MVDRYRQSDPGKAKLARTIDALAEFSPMQAAIGAAEATEGATVLGREPPYSV
jgi:hypothetical protein